MLTYIQRLLQTENFYNSEAKSKISSEYKLSRDTTYTCTSTSLISLNNVSFNVSLTSWLTAFELFYYLTIVLKYFFEFS